MDAELKDETRRTLSGLVHAWAKGDKSGAVTLLNGTADHRVLMLGLVELSTAAVLAAGEYEVMFAHLMRPDGPVGWRALLDRLLKEEPTDSKNGESS